MRAQFDKQLEKLQLEMQVIGHLCENAINDCARALMQGDASGAKQLKELVNHIVDHERYVEDICVKLLMQQQPVARDLRRISAALKMVTDMKRIGDQSGDIADIIAIGNIDAEVSVEGFESMVSQVVMMVNKSVDAFVNNNLELACHVLSMDDVVDKWFIDIRTNLLRGLKAAEPAYSDETALDLLMIDKYLERIADHAVNVAKWVIFSETGEITQEK